MKFSGLSFYQILEYEVNCQIVTIPKLWYQKIDLLEKPIISHEFWFRIRLIFDCKSITVRISCNPDFLIFLIEFFFINE